MAKGKITSIRCALIRGGTSKGVVFLEKDLPKQKSMRNKIILNIFGSPDKRQIDGLGGANPLTSKVAIVAKAKSKNFDINYTFGQVDIEKPEINYGVMCGNIAAGVALYALQKKMVAAKGPQATVRILNTNTGKGIRASLPLVQGKPEIETVAVGSDTRKGTKIMLEFINPQGMITGTLFPTGNTEDEIVLSAGQKIKITLIDAGNVYALTTANSLHREETKTFLSLLSDKELERKCAEISQQAAVLLKHTISPKVAVLQRSATPSADVQGLIFSNGKMHQAYAVTGAINTALLLCFRGNVADGLGLALKDSLAPIRIAHPSGILEIKIAYETKNGTFFLKSAFVERTARIILEGTAYISL